MTIPFNKATITDGDIALVHEAIANGHISGTGPFTKRCEAAIQDRLGAPRALLTTSCTHALEMSALLCQLQPGDEVIVPAFTFVTSASAFALFGARPVFVDVQDDTLNLDPVLVEQAVTPRTKAIVVVHYGGIAADIERLASIAQRNGLILIEDNAHGLFHRWKGRPLGTFGAMATHSFHETKNVTCGEGGALVVNDPSLVERAEILREKGTDRSRFLRGQVDKYTWVDIGSSWIPSDMLAAILAGQLSRFESIAAARLRIFDRYAAELAGWAAEHGVRLPVVPEGNEHTAHLFSLRFARGEQRDRFIAHMKERGISAVFHYQPLHLSTVGRRFGGRDGQCPVTEQAGDCLVRLPLYVSLSDAQQDEVVAGILEFRP